jgi:DNA-binding NtrC family response regulator
MPYVHIRIRGGAESKHEIPVGEGILVGRLPDVRRLHSAPPIARITPVTLASEHVSANHALIWATREGVFCLDLASRNGSSLRLPRSHPTQVAAVDVTLDLAPAAGSADARGPTLSATWSTEAEFGPSLCEAVTRWVDAQGADLSVALASGAAPARGTALALATGDQLVLSARAGATSDQRLTAWLDAIAAFVQAQNALFDEDHGHADDLVLASPRIRAAHRKVCDAAASGRRLLLLGPSGAGKERLAECFHHHSRRAEGPFKAVNCALIGEDMIWVQLFGAARGAYTGAVRDVVGAVEAARGGTLFLDEIGELSARVQAALLRFLDRRGEYERLGDPRTRTSDVQLVCATNRDLRVAIAKGSFREDLWYRFAGFVVEVPPLSERREDMLAFLARRQVSRDLDARAALSPEALDVLARHPWQGNFRELENFVQRLPAATRPGEISVAVCEAALREGSVQVPDAAGDSVLPGPVGARDDWRALFEQATDAWQADHDGATPSRYGEIRDFVEAYWKPVVMASYGEITSGRPVNYSAIGRRLDIADGTTVRKYLDRFASRFAR